MAFLRRAMSSTPLWWSPCFHFGMGLLGMHFMHSLKSEHNTIFMNHIHQSDNVTRQKVNGKVIIIYWLI